MKRIVNFLRLWPEWWCLPLAFIGFLYFPVVLQTIDPEAGVYDLGILQILAYTMLSAVVLNAFAWLGIKMNFPSIFSYYAKDLANDFKSLEVKYKITIVMVVYAIMYFSLIIISRIIK